MEINNIIMDTFGWDERQTKVATEPLFKRYMKFNNIEVKKPIKEQCEQSNDGTLDVFFQ
jgi:hypothetical protein